MTQDSWISSLISGFISLFPCVSSCCVLLHSFLQIPSLCSIYFHLLWFETRRSVYPNNNEKQQCIVPCHTRAGFNHAGLLCSSLLRGSGSYCSSLPPSVVLTYNTAIRMQEPQISASIYMPSCSNLSRHCTPKHWLPSWANPSAMSTSLSWGALLFLLLCLNTAMRCLLPVWTSDEALLMPVLLAHYLYSPSGHCPLTGGLLVFGNAVLLTVPTAFACCISTVLLG